MSSTNIDLSSSEDEIEVIDAAESHPAYKAFKGYGKLSAKEKQGLLAPFAESKYCEGLVGFSRGSFYR